MSARVTRPIEATFLALALGWLALGGFGNAFVWRVARESFRPPEASPFAHLLEAMSSPLFTCIAFTYGVTALIACIGVWRMRPWMTKAFLAWGISVILTGAWMVWALPAEVFMGGAMSALVGVIACVALLWFGYQYVQRIALRAAQVNS